MGMKKVAQLLLGLGTVFQRIVEPYDPGIQDEQDSPLQSTYEVFPERSNSPGDHQSNDAAIDGDQFISRSPIHSSAAKAANPARANKLALQAS